MTVSLVGSRLGRYEVLEEIGQGGMSVVYRAEDTQLQREVAIKVMHSFLAEQPEARERFHREAVAVARLRHPHIIEIFDYSGEDADTSYIVTELVRGAALADAIRDLPFCPPEAAMVLARPIAEALAHAHNSGVIHRDLKPENILVGKRGELKLTDFGIARMLDSHTLTMTGTLLGSPAYMAPEYVEGCATDNRADIFSFGAMLYQFAVGHLPFEAATPHALLKRIASGDFVPPQQANPELHGQMARIIERCLQRRPEDRYGNMDDVLSDIDRVLERLDLDVERDLVSLLADPIRFRDQLGCGLPQRYLALGKAALGEGRHGEALEDFDRVLSLTPDNREVRHLLDRMARRTWLRKAVRDAALGIVGALLLTVVVGSAIDWYRNAGVRADPPRVVPVSPDPVPETTRPMPIRRNVTLVLRGTGDVFIDGRMRRQRATGLLAIELDSGPHEVRLVGSHKTATQKIQVPAEGEIQPLNLDVHVVPPANDPEPPAVRNVEFKVANTWVNVEVDGEEKLRHQMGRFVLPLSDGPHQLRFSNELSIPNEMTVRVSEHEPPEAIVVRMLPQPARLLIHGAPDGAVVEVAGKRTPINEWTRETPIRVNLVLDPGEGSQAHEVVVRKDGYAEFRQTLKLRPGQEQVLEVQLKRQ